MSYQFINDESGFCRIVNANQYCFFGANGNLHEKNGRYFCTLDLSAEILPDPIIGASTEEFSQKRSEFLATLWLPHHISITSSNVTLISYLRFEADHLRGAICRIPSDLVLSRHPHRQAFKLAKNIESLEVVPFDQKISSTQENKIQPSTGKLTRLTDESVDILAKARQKIRVQ